MTARPHRTIAFQLQEPNDIATGNDGAHSFRTPMIPGAREPGMPTTFGVQPVVTPNSPSTMDAATIAAREREGGGAPNQRGRAGDGSPSKNLGQKLRRFLLGS